MTSSKTRFRPSPALVISFVALFTAMSGAAMALPGQDTVNSGDVVNETLKSVDLKNGAGRCYGGRNRPDVAERRHRSRHAGVAGSGPELGRILVEVADNAVGSTEIADNAVTSTEIADNAVTEDELANNSVRATGAGRRDSAPLQLGQRKRRQRGERPST